MSTGSDERSSSDRVLIIKRLFLDRKFFHYTWIGVVVTLFNIVALYLAIDVLGIHTVISGTALAGCTFVLRYVLFYLAGMLR